MSYKITHDGNNHWIAEDRDTGITAKSTYGPERAVRELRKKLMPSLEDIRFDIVGEEGGDYTAVATHEGTTLFEATATGPEAALRVCKDSVETA